MYNNAHFIHILSMNKKKKRIFIQIITKHQQYNRTAYSYKKTCSYYIIKIVKRKKKVQSTRKSPDDVDRRKKKKEF